MEISVKFKVRPFTVPNVVTIDPPAHKIDGYEFVESSKLRLSNLEPDHLLKLCEDFKTAVFEKANKQPPPISCDCGR